MSKPTAGKWKAHKPKDSDGYWYIDRNGRGQGEVAVCYGENSKANASFIASAKDLLASLKRRLDPQHITTDAEDEADRQLIARIEVET